ALAAHDHFRVVRLLDRHEIRVVAGGHHLARLREAVTLLEKTHMFSKRSQPSTPTTIPVPGTIPPSAEVPSPADAAKRPGRQVRAMCRTASPAPAVLQPCPD